MAINQNVRLINILLHEVDIKGICGKTHISLLLQTCHSMSLDHSCLRLLKPTVDQK